MKRIMSILAVLAIMGLLVSVALAAEIPAPFSKAKELALASQPDEYGNYVLFFNAGMEGEDYYYIVGYLSSKGTIGIGIRRNGVVGVWEYYEQSETFSIYFDGGLTSITKEEAIEGAFKIFRKLVGQNSI